MKTPLLIFIACLSLFTSSYSLSCGCENQPSSCGQNPCAESENYCQCTDINSGKNPCLDKNDYCRDFGNVGDNKLSNSTRYE